MLSTTKDAAGGPIVESVLNKKTLRNKTLYEVHIKKKLPAFPQTVLFFLMIGFVGWVF